MHGFARAEPWPVAIAAVWLIRPLRWRRCCCCLLRPLFLGSSGHWACQETQAWCVVAMPVLQHPRLQDPLRQRQSGDHPREHRGCGAGPGGAGRGRQRTGAARQRQRRMPEKMPKPQCAAWPALLAFDGRTASRLVCCSFWAVPTVQASTLAWSTRWCPVWLSRSRQAAGRGEEGQRCRLRAVRSRLLSFPGGSELAAGCSVLPANTGRT